VLHIDDGGKRGIVPAVWLNEIENRVHRPISHLFNVMIGNGTGSITTSALSYPKDLNQE
jgi:patatin-like phospholipase/acyl hydrolase